MFSIDFDFMSVDIARGHHRSRRPHHDQQLTY